MKFKKIQCYCKTLITYNLQMFTCDTGLYHLLDLALLVGDLDSAHGGGLLSHELDLLLHEADLSGGQLDI